ncbi:MAG: ribosomal protein S18-alanine N-acetyltransferase [Oscillospiraceae bacterium]|nr:ribosomal protein S18-alanine N-acetyltransferase [Oscillospiraceae bacterium]
MPKVKRLTERDIPLLEQAASLERKCFADPWSYEMFQLEATRRGGMVLAAVNESGKLMGFLTASYVMDTADLTNVAVHPEFRRQGVGGMLIEAMLQELGDGVEVLLEVRVSNHAAIGMYESFGFVPVGTRKNYYDHPVEDAILMKRDARRDASSDGNEEV